MLGINKGSPDWTGELNIKDVFEPELTFNRTEWLKEANYMRFVREDENHSIGGVNPGMYRLMDETWSMTICSNADSEEEVLAQLSKIPNNDQFKKIIIK